MTWSLKTRGEQWFEALIPANLVGDGLLTVVLVPSNPTNPCDVGGPKPCVKIGVNVRELQIVRPQ